MLRNETEQRKFVLVLGPALDARGGVATVLNVYKEFGLFERNNVLHVVTHSDGPLLLKLAVAFRACFHVAWQLSVGAVSLIHSHTSERSSFWRKSIFFFLAKLAGVPFITHLHAPEFDKFYCAECGPIRKWLVRLVLEGSARVVVLADFWKSEMEKVCPAAQLTRIYNPIRVAGNFEQKNRKPYFFLFLGRLGKRKGVTDLVRAIREVKKVIPEVKLFCGGDGEIEAVRNEIESFDLSRNVEVLGWLDSAQKQRLFQECACLILPSYGEGLPMAILEAMSVGLAVIATPVGGIPECVQHGLNGLIIPVGDVDLLASEIISIAKLDKNPYEMGGYGRALVQERFSPEVVLADVEKLYNDVRGLR
jgi:glycosyltransferase involved in cell wall biosynthesis